MTTQITLEDVSSHIYELCVDSESGQDLGIISKDPKLDITFQNSDYSIEQSISNLNNSSSSTGFVLWKITIPFIKWLQQRNVYDFHGKFVIEIGSGVTGLLASTIGPKTGHYISTDQYHLLKLLKKNIINNVPLFRSSTMECEGIPKRKHALPVLDVVTFDWEHIDQGLFEINQVQNGDPDFIIGCDVVYNDYLVPFLVDSIVRLMGDDTKVLMGLQLRLPENIEHFVTVVLEKGLKIFKHDEELLIDELKTGFVVYLITK
ncbi:putative nicotinamide N-methyltransferase [Wickerhamomyces ciferrii]|uniref:Ribosomal lysine N-methyltransferase 5 n=1 Tax=Wickerhamomyces ciferrii (strain ATCC 14091 / BCRC 22168 / CBS 111 / JCM 3599 / NBRC 0793 / NRRL Y-1031 F-60-10) TaxID=1206466 RepID=K0KWT0_WICCF|nr:putative nicotinamide N-methyltransferase [Wickerhamomyces ciferrii]CCH46492.1 putative nicotinamide N-methyltransferase [Wickerhamomyces ciferrii]